MEPAGACCACDLETPPSATISAMCRQRQHVRTTRPMETFIFDPSSLIPGNNSSQLLVDTQQLHIKIKVAIWRYHANPLRPLRIPVPAESSIAFGRRLSIPATPSSHPFITWPPPRGNRKWFAAVAGTVKLCAAGQKNRCSAHDHISGHGYRSAAHHNIPILQAGRCGRRLAIHFHWDWPEPGAPAFSDLPASICNRNSSTTTPIINAIDIFI